MTIVIVCVLVLLLSAGGLLLYRHYFVLRKWRALVQQKYHAIEPLLEKLTGGRTITMQEVLSMAKDPAMRLAVFRILDEYERVDLFPPEYMTRPMGAESFMVNWLEYPTELGRTPDESELLEEVLFNGDKDLVYFVFRFRTVPPHWAARRGWMMGVTGPHAALAMPFDPPLRVFSRFKGIYTVSPASEVQWVHEHINPG
jgi:hypothetical protein